MDDDLAAGQGVLLNQDEHLAFLDETSTAPEPAASGTVPSDTTEIGHTTRRTLKLVLTLDPGTGPGYQALLAVSSPDCDPIYRSIAVDGVAAALAAIPALIADAEARWQTQPRYSALPQPPAKPAGRSQAKAPPLIPAKPTQAEPKDDDASSTEAAPVPVLDPANSSPASPDHASVDSSTPPAATPTRSVQLSLFDA